MGRRFSGSWIVLSVVLFIGNGVLADLGDVRTLRGHFFIGSAREVVVDVNWTGKSEKVGNLAALAVSNNKSLSSNLVASGQDPNTANWIVYTDYQRSTQLQMDDTVGSAGPKKL